MGKIPGWGLREERKGSTKKQKDLWRNSGRGKSSTRESTRKNEEVYR